jgi:acyl-CoA synthetase (AMP-forming)/AMP-acid ligase II
MADTIPAVLREAAARHRDKTALIAPGIAPMSFTALDALTDRFARALIADGLAPGDRVGVWVPNAPEWIAAAIGAQRAGGVMIPLYTRLAGPEVADILARAKVGWLLCTAELAASLPREGLSLLKRIIVLDHGDGGIGWDDFLAAGRAVDQAALHEREAALTGDTVSDIMFTSGTTGRPKGALFRHRSGVLAAGIMQDYNRTTDKDCFCPMGTFAHVGGYKQGWLTGLVSGATIAWGTAFDPPSTLELISSLGITIMPAPPITWQGVLDYPQRGERDISSLRFAATGGTMIPPEIVRRLVAELKLDQVGTGYGMTETCGMNAYTRKADPVEKVVGTVGQPAPDTEIRIVDGEGRDLPVGEAGEIIVRNPRTLLAYLDDPAATAASLTSDGWFHTGDVGSFDQDGYLRITDRLKDMYIINGLNVYPAEIERLLETLDGVAQVAVVGLPDPRKGEVGGAFIVRAPGATLGEADVIEWCKRNVAGYKVPASVSFVEELPRNVMGKVLKNELRKVTA